MMGTPLKLCTDGHSPFMFAGVSCPYCEALNRLRLAEAELAQVKVRLEEMKAAQVVEVVKVAKDHGAQE